MRTLIRTLLLTLFALSAQAAEKPAAAQPGAPLPPPPLPPASAPGQDSLPQPQVTIKTKGHETIEEYRVNGRLYMIKITPSHGYPYYLIDTTGDGKLDSRRNELENPPINQWILFRW